MKPMILVLTGLLASAGTAHAARLQPAPATTAARGAEAVLGARPIAQMTDNTPVTAGGVSCSDWEAGTTSATSWWRRFYLSEHGAPTSLAIESVTVGTESGTAPVTIRLHTIPHAVPAGTIPTDQLTLIGQSAQTLVSGQLDTATIPVAGLVADAAGTDLVVEYHVDAYPLSAFYAGGNPSPQTHEALISAPGCGVPAPTPLSALGFADAHMIIVANAAAPAVALDKAFAPEVVRAPATSTLTITLVNPFAQDAQLTADLTDTFPAGLRVATPPNAGTTCGGALTAPAGGGAITLAAAGASIPADGRCTIQVDVTSDGGTHVNQIAAGALRTDRGDSVQAATATLSVVPAGGNGIVRHAFNQPIAATGLRTSFDLVGGQTSEGTASAYGWDVGLGLGYNGESPLMVTLVLQAIAASQAQFVVDGNGHAAMLADGATVGPAATYSSEPDVLPDPAWLAGGDGALGVRFRCNGRLPYPVEGSGVCYGYLRLATFGLAGLPAQIIESVIDGDGAPITVALPAPVQPPSASVAPAVLNVSVAANMSREAVFTLANASGSLPLRYAIAAQGTASGLRPHPRTLAKAGATEEEATALSLPAVTSPVVQQPVRGYGADPAGTSSAVIYRLDDGSYDRSLGLGQFAGIWLNRYNVLEAQTIDSVSVMWPRQLEGGSLLGLTANLVAYYDADGDGDPSNAVRLGSDRLVTIDTLDVFQTYATAFVVPGPGDVYLGMVEHWAMNGYPGSLYAAAVDSSVHRARSYLSLNMPSDGAPAPLDLDNLAANDMTGLASMIGVLGNFMIRATGAGTSCTGPALPWLSATVPGDAVAGGALARIRVTVDPAAGGLAPGNHEAQLCIATNDPAHPVLAVPVHVEVTAPLAAHACSTHGDGLFCTGFEAPPEDDLVVSGLLNLELPATESGLSFNFGRQDWDALPLYGDDFQPYWSSMRPHLMFYWFGDVHPGRNGGVADTVFGPYSVLQPGDTIGPDSTFSEVANGEYGETRYFLAGVDGYLGFKFYNEETGLITYGYLHLATTWPTGYPARLLRYAYNRSGGPITIP